MFNMYACALHKQIIIILVEVGILLIQDSLAGNIGKSFKVCMTISIVTIAYAMEFTFWQTAYFLQTV